MDNFVTLTKDKIVDLISNAEKQVVYIGPAMESNLANEIIQFVKRTSVERVSISMDLSPEVYREGYGDLIALTILKDAGINITDISGLRMAVLIVDYQSWIYSPISKISSPFVKKNALYEKINQEFLTSTIEPEQLPLFDTETEVEETKFPNASKEYKLDEKIEQIKVNIEKDPLPNFETLKFLSDYRSLVQFIEFTFNGARIEQKTVKIPSELLNLTQDKEFEEKMKATYKLFSEDLSQYTKNIKGKIDNLRDKYTYPLSKKYGRIILVKNKKEFENTYHDLTKELEIHKQNLIKHINNQIKKTKEKLKSYFKQVIINNPPNHLINELNKTVDEKKVESYIGWLLDKEFPTSHKILNRISLDFAYKDITEETLKDNQFFQDLDKAFKDKPIRFPHQKNSQETFIMPEDMLFNLAIVGAAKLAHSPLMNYVEFSDEMTKYLGSR